MGDLRGGPGGTWEKLTSYVCPQILCPSGHPPTLKRPLDTGRGIRTERAARFRGRSVGGVPKEVPGGSRGGPGGSRRGPGGVPERSRRGPGGVPAGSRGGPGAPRRPKAVPKGIPKKIVRVRGRFWPDLGANLGGFGGLLGANLGHFGGIVFDIIFEPPPEPVWDPFGAPKVAQNGFQIAPKGVRNAKCGIIKNVEKPMGFCYFQASRPFEEGFESSFLETSLPRGLSRRKKCPRRPDLGPSWPPKRVQNRSPNGQNSSQIFNRNSERLRKAIWTEK